MKILKYEDESGVMLPLYEIYKPNTSLIIDGYEAVDMGEAGIWATCNIGASKPEDYGLYFAWGETTGYAQASNKGGGFYWPTAPYLTSGTSSSWTKWSKYTSTDEYSSNGVADNKLILEPEDDAAHVNMGGKWRMPTKDNFQALYDACNIIWTTQNEVNGLLFTLKTDSSKQLFFPAAGDAYEKSMRSVGSLGYYWASSLGPTSYDAYNLRFVSSSFRPQYNIGRFYGFPVRGFIPKSE